MVDTSKWCIAAPQMDHFNQDQYIMAEVSNMGLSVSKKEESSRISHQILIVDDDPVTRCVLDGMLHNAGFETICVDNLEGAENALASCSVSLILLDNHLPDGKGLDLCRKLSLHPSTAQTPILFISANMDIALCSTEAIPYH